MSMRNYNDKVLTYHEQIEREAKALLAANEKGLAEKEKPRKRSATKVHQVEKLVRANEKKAAGRKR